MSRFQNRNPGLLWSFWRKLDWFQPVSPHTQLWSIFLIASHQKLQCHPRISPGKTFGMEKIAKMKQLSCWRPVELDAIGIRARDCVLSLCPDRVLVTEQEKIVNSAESLDKMDVVRTRQNICRQSEVCLDESGGAFVMHLKYNERSKDLKKWKKWKCQAVMKLICGEPVVTCFLSEWN